MTVFSDLPSSPYEPVIGVEVHIQLATRSKVFCCCANIPLAEPNTHICEICTGQPGSLPLLNAQVVMHALKVALATNCTIDQASTFVRKHYFYPDLPKNFQITQGDRPIARDGVVTARRENGSLLSVRIKRIHIEEDAGKSTHVPSQNCTLVDLNRAGTPLLEIVSEPDMHSPEDVRTYLQELHAIVTSLGICSGNMEEGAFRADTNISVRSTDSTILGTRCELKNINSFKFISDATTYEIDRQIELIERGEKVVQQTRLWDLKTKTTVAMRSKEEAADYRYMMEPDLPPLIIETEQIEAARASLPELPFKRMERLQAAYHLTAYEANIIAYDKHLSVYFEKAYTFTQSPKLIHWILRDLLGTIKEQNISTEQILSDRSPLRPERLAELVELIEKGAINARSAQEVFQEMIISYKAPTDIVAQKGLQQMGSPDELRTIISEILAQYPTQVVQYKQGNNKLWGFFVGKVMEQTKGRAAPQVINELLKSLLA